MAILIVCPCGKLQRVPYSYEGKEIRCLNCGKIFRVLLKQDGRPDRTWARRK